jgi:DNA-binding HxlR family transcriptional regulator
MKTKTSLKNPDCVVAAVSVLGDKWNPLLIRALLTRSMRFCELQIEVGGVNPRTLSSKLHYLESQGIIIRLTYPEIPPRVEYSLTKKGQDLSEIIKKMASWSSKYRTESRATNP